MQQKEVNGLNLDEGYGRLKNVKPTA